MENKERQFKHCKLARLIDGDTFILDIDMGFDVHVHPRIRVIDFKAPERNTPEGIKAISHAAEVLEGADRIEVITLKDERSFERWLAWVKVDGMQFSYWMTQRGVRNLLKKGQRNE
jgi:micrococcal nuclease